MAFRTGDPLDDFNRLDRIQAQREAKLPICERCRKRITEETFYYDEEEILCEDCLKEKYEKNTEDWLNDHY